MDGATTVQAASASADRATLRADLRAASVWGVLAGVSTVALLPYLMQLMPERFAALPVPLPVLAFAQLLQATLVIGLLAFLGLRMGHRTGLGSPLLQGRFGGHRVGVRGAHAAQAVALGVAVALAVVALSALVDPLLPAMRNPPAPVAAGRSALNGLLASFYGGIAEELQLRLFLVTLLVWVVARMRGRTPRPAVYWGAIAAAALLFGAGHLPAAAQLWGLDAAVVARTVLLNALAGVVFGWVYWKRGLELAVLAHFSADLVVHALVPLAGLAR